MTMRLPPREAGEWSATLPVNLFENFAGSRVNEQLCDTLAECASLFGRRRCTLANVLRAVWRANRVHLDRGAADGPAIGGANCLYPRELPDEAWQAFRRLRRRRSRAYLRGDKSRESRDARARQSEYPLRCARQDRSARRAEL